LKKEFQGLHLEGDNPGYSL